MTPRKKTYNSIARSFRSKPNHIMYLFFFVRMRDKLKTVTEATTEAFSRIFSQ